MQDAEIRPLLSIKQKLIHDEEERIWSIHNREVLCCMKMLLSYRQQKSTSSQIRDFVSEAELQNIHNLYSRGRTESNYSHKLLRIVNWTTLMEIRSCSSGRFSEGTSR